MTAVSPGPCPYPGPRPFAGDDESLFFGREREAKDLLSLITAHQIVLLYAPSGVGKTSLLKAGVIPRLTAEGFEVLPVAHVGGFAPGNVDLEEIPNIYVFNALVGWVGDAVEPRSLTSMSFADFLEDREHPVDGHGLLAARVIVFDQFEELFTSYPGRWKEREEFFRQVATVLEMDPLSRVLFVVREDYLASLDSYVDLLPERPRTWYRLEGLRAEAACQAVEGPLRGTERSFALGVASELVQKLLKTRVRSVTGEIVEIIGEYVEAVQLQLVCQHLWESLPPEVVTLTSDHLHDLADVGTVLRDFYESAIDATAARTGVGKADLRRWFQTELITPAGTRGTVFQGTKTTGSIPNKAVEELLDRHVIRSEVRARARWYELTDDRLIEPIRRSNETWFRGGGRIYRWRARELAKRVMHFRPLTGALLVMFLVALGSSAYAVRQQVVARRQTQAARIDLETLQSAARDYLALLRALERGLSPQQTAAVSEAEDHLRSLLQELEETPQEDLDARRRLLRRFNAEAKSVTLGVER